MDFPTDIKLSIFWNLFLFQTNFMFFVPIDGSPFVTEKIKITKQTA